MLLCIGGGMLRAQQRVILQRPLVIPSRGNSTLDEVVAASGASQIANASSTGDARHAAVPQRQPGQERLDARLQPSLMAAAAPAPEPRPAAAKPAQNPEMIARMRIAVEQIAAEYGNPTFAQVFTNDPLQAQLMRKRLQLVQRVDLLKSEIDSLEQQRLAMKNEVEATRRELFALQQQAEALATKIQRASTLLSLAK